MFTKNLTSAQMNYVMGELTYRNTSRYSLSFLLHADNFYSYDAINNALNNLVENFDAYRIHITTEQESPKQYIEKFEFQYFPLVEFQDAKQFENWINGQKNKCIFDFNQDLYEFKIVKKPDGNHSIFFLHHHTITDVWSITHTVNYIAKTLIGQNMEDNSYSYISAVENEQQYIASKRFEIDKNYWTNKLYNYEIVSYLPILKSAGYTSLRNSYHLNEYEFNLLHKICSDFSISISTLFMSLVHLYISKLSSRNKNSVGLMLHNRSSETEKSICGLFTNALPLIVEINPEQSVETFINLVKKENFSLLKHRKFPSHLLVEEMKDNNPLALVDWIISYQSVKYDSEITKAGFNDEWLINKETVFNTLNIHLSDRNNKNTLHIDYDFNTRYLSASAVEHIHHSLMKILSQFHNNHDVCLKDIEVDVI
ncbi:peptide synthetase [Staphylococcus xylosus]|uniref:condensation domain-containing protein n=1 Tax=Staphylococcus xylosus TaxID=1288 RepID=UPI000D1D5CE9|nr:condensation domain-containing protein [Staphylococcus xylosus]PTI03960.1 peptide synthetase [Staphylococcus xylosus]